VRAKENSAKNISVKLFINSILKKFIISKRQLLTNAEHYGNAEFFRRMKIVITGIKRRRVYFKVIQNLFSRRDAFGAESFLWI